MKIELLNQMAAQIKDLSMQLKDLEAQEVALDIEKNNIIRVLDATTVADSQFVGKDASCEEKRGHNATFNTYEVYLEKQGNGEWKVNTEYSFAGVIFFAECQDCLGAGFRKSEWKPCPNDKRVREIDERKAVLEDRKRRIIALSTEVEERYKEELGGASGKQSLKSIQGEIVDISQLARSESPQVEQEVSDAQQ